MCKFKIIKISQNFMFVLCLNFMLNKQNVKRYFYDSLKNFQTSFYMVLKALTLRTFFNKAPLSVNVFTPNNFTKRIIQFLKKYYIR